MRSLPRNPAGLTDRHLADVRRELIRIITDRKVEPVDRVRAAKEIRGWANDVWKWSAGPKVESDAAKKGDADTAPDKCPLDDLRVVG